MSVTSEEAYYVVLRTVVAGNQANWVRTTISATLCPVLQHEAGWRQAPGVGHAQPLPASNVLRLLLHLRRVKTTPLPAVAERHGPHGSAAQADGRVG